MTEAEIQKRYAAGRGSGDGPNYRPWIEHHDLSSNGLSSRIHSAKFGRLHHLLSGIEAGAFLEFELNPRVVDVQEQYPLDREDTRTIAQELGVRHPTYPGGRVDVVLTTDLVVHVSEAEGVRRIARAVKLAADLDLAEVLLKLEIERLYWARRNVQWMLITEQDQSQRRRNGLEWMHARYDLEHERGPDHWADRIEAVLTACGRDRRKTFAEVERVLRSRGILEAGEMIEIVRHLCARGRMRFDPETVFSLDWPVGRIPVVPCSA